MEAGSTLRATRIQAGLTQAELAARAGTSQATLSAYENGTKEPSVATFSRLLAAAGARLAVEPLPAARPTRRAGERLAQVLTLAEALPARPARALRYPRIDRAA